MRQQRLDVQADGVPDVPLDLFCSLAVAEATRQGRAVGRVALVLCFLLDGDDDAVMCHASTYPQTLVGSGIGSPSSRRPSTWNRMASRMFCLASSFVAPVADRKSVV